MVGQPRISGMSKQCGGLAQFGRALEWHSRGRRFDPDILHQSSLEAQQRAKTAAPKLAELARLTKAGCINPAPSFEILIAENRGNW
jgi:hypothetical protein